MCRDLPASCRGEELLARFPGWLRWVFISIVCDGKDTPRPRLFQDPTGWRRCFISQVTLYFQDPGLWPLPRGHLRHP